MKNIKYIILLLVAIVVNSCKRDIDPPNIIFNPTGRDQVVVRDVKVLSYSAKKVELELKINMLNYYIINLTEKYWGDYVLSYGNKLPNSAFEFEANDIVYDYKTVLKSKNAANSNIRPKALSTLFLVDNTLDSPLTDTDAGYKKNQRFEALNYYYLNNKKPDNFAVAAFGEGGKMGADVKFCTNFSDDWQKQASETIQLSEQEGGTNNLYDALEQSIDYIDINAKNPNKNIVLITHTVPTEASGFRQLAEKAKQKGIKISVIDLNFISQTDAFVFGQLTQLTGGFYAIASPDARGFGSVMLQLPELLNRLYQELVIKLEITYIGTQSNYFEKGFTYSHTVQLGYFKGPERNSFNRKKFIDEFEFNQMLYVFELK